MYERVLYTNFRRQRHDQVPDCIEDQQYDSNDDRDLIRVYTENIKIAARISLHDRLTS